MSQLFSRFGLTFALYCGANAKERGSRATSESGGKVTQVDTIMTTTFSVVPFADLAIGEKFSLTNRSHNERYGPYTKVETRQCAQSSAFYRSQNAGFWGWNATRPYWNGDAMVEGQWSLAPETECLRESLK